MPAFLVPLLLFISLSMHAQDFGTFGKTFHIQEQDILEFLRNRLQSATHEEQELIARKLAKLASEPKPLNLPDTERYRCFFYDPSVTAKVDVKDDEGNIIVKRGAKYNPLDHCSLNSALLFFDATQESQIEWAKTNDGTWILVRGKPIELEETEGRPVYFDQFGYLTTKLGIKTVPAKVSQDGKLLKIEEIREVGR